MLPRPDIVIFKSIEHPLEESNGSSKNSAHRKARGRSSNTNHSHRTKIGIVILIFLHRIFTIREPPNRSG